ncbi:hypothetical protein QTN25_003703 [Entamoeba marina]
MFHYNDFVHNANIIYDSDVAESGSIFFQEALSGKKNVLVVIVTDKDVYGIYHYKFPKVEKKIYEIGIEKRIKQDLVLCSFINHTDNKGIQCWKTTGEVVLKGKQFKRNDDVLYFVVPLVWVFVPFGKKCSGIHSQISHHIKGFKGTELTGYQPDGLDCCIVDKIMAFEFEEELNFEDIRTMTINQ